MKSRYIFSFIFSFDCMLPIQVCAAQQGRDFGTPDLERGIHIRDVS